MDCHGEEPQSLRNSLEKKLIEPKDSIETW